MVQKVWLAWPTVLYLLAITWNCDVGFIHHLVCCLILTSLPKVDMSISALAFIIFGLFVCFLFFCFSFWVTGFSASEASEWLMWGNQSVIRVVCLDSSRDKLWILIQLHCYIFLFHCTLLFLLWSALLVAPYPAVTGAIILENLCRFFKGIGIGVCFEGSQFILWMRYGFMLWMWTRK